MTEYDVVIIGAGPGGLNCAKFLKESGKKVIVLEQNPVVGPKVCAGGLSQHSMQYLELPLELIGFKSSQALICTPLNKTLIKFDQDFVHTIDRKVLGQWQLQSVKELVKVNSRVTEIGDDYVIVNGSQRLSFKFLIGADGSNSFVRKHLGVKTEEYGIGIQYLIKDERFKDAEFHYNSGLFKSWYAWIFPHKSFVSVGFGYDPRRFSSEKANKNFSKWLAKNKIDVSEIKKQAFTINCDYRGYKFGNIYLIGDAAGLASGLTGEGIYQALVSSEEVAKEIVNPNYTSDKIPLLLERRDEQNRLLNRLHRLEFLRPIAYELLALMVRKKSFAKRLIDKLS